MNNTIKIFLILFLSLLRVNFIFSQVNQEWIARYSVTDIDEAIAMSIDSIGNVYITGYSRGIGSFEDYATIKYNSSGVKQWVSRYNGPGNGSDFAYAVELDKDGNVYVTGESKGIGTGSDYTTIKYNSSGIQQWVERHSSSGNNRDAAYAIELDDKCNSYVTGESKNDIGGIDYLTIKYDSLGNELWMSKFNRGINSSNKAYDLTYSSSGDVFVTGRSNGDFATVKYNSFGIQQWVSIYNGPMNGNDAGEVVKVDTLGNVYVSGSSIGAMFYYDYATVKYDSLGKEQWVRRYEGSGNYMDQVNDMTIDKAGNVYVTGNSTESGQGYNMTTIKYNTNGDTVWKASYNNGSNDIAFGIAVDNQGNVYVTGESDGSGTNEDYVTVKYNSFGVQQWIMRYDYSGQFGDYPQAIALDNNGSVFVTGSSDRDYLTIKYSQLTGATLNESNIPTDYFLSQNYPNPFNPVTHLEFGISDWGFVSLKVNDVLGSEIKTLVNEIKPAGNYEIEFDGSHLSSGIYFYSLLIDGNVIDTKRMVLLK